MIVMGILGLDLRPEGSLVQTKKGPGQARWVRVPRLNANITHQIASLVKLTPKSHPPRAMNKVKPSTGTEAKPFNLKEKASPLCRRTPSVVVHGPAWWPAVPRPRSMAGSPEEEPFGPGECPLGKALSMLLIRVWAS